MSIKVQVRIAIDAVYPQGTVGLPRRYSLGRTIPPCA
jgi:hypothetical protein